MLVKICGITRIEDAELAVECGAHALGFVFWPGSPRVVEPERVRAIVDGLPPFVTSVGVFVNQPSDVVNRIADRAGLGAVQLHGDESPEYATTLSRPVLKAVALGASAVSVEAWPRRTLLLLDVHDPERRGGTGRTVDWNLAAALAHRRRVVLAGGLNPENVGDAIARVDPFGIDVSSGVERSPGIKDRTRLVALFSAIRATQMYSERENH